MQTPSIKRQYEGGKLVQPKSHLQKTKNTSDPHNQSVVSIQIQ